MAHMMYLLQTCTFFTIVKYLQINKFIKLSIIITTVQHQMYSKCCKHSVYYRLYNRGGDVGMAKQPTTTTKFKLNSIQLDKLQ